MKRKVMDPGTTFTTDGDGVRAPVKEAPIYRKEGEESLLPIERDWSPPEGMTPEEIKRWDERSIAIKKEIIEERMKEEDQSRWKQKKPLSRRKTRQG